jgi:hypothetical protein
MKRIGRWVRKHPFFCIAIAGMVGWTLFLFIVSPQEVVQRVGIENSYLILFLLGLVGGVSVLTSGSFYASVLAFAGEGATPYLLGIAGGIGLLLSDAVFYYLVLYGKTTLKGGMLKRLEVRLEKVLQKLPAPLMLGGVFAYSILPLPSDLLMAALALSGIPFLRFALILFAGNTAAITLIATLSMGLDLF